METPNKVKVSGGMQINGAADGSELYVCMSDGYLQIISAWRCEIRIYTFNRIAASVRGNGLISKPREYMFEGTFLGTVTQTFGAMSETEFYNRNIRNVKILIRHSRSRIEYQIVGFSELPDGVAQDPRSKPPGNWDFAINFFIPREQVGAIYGLSQSAAGFYLKEMDEL